MPRSECLPVAKACGNCAKAKAKCERTTNNGSCPRCFRLGKECTPQESVRKRKAPKIRRDVQIAQLEEKVNGLLSVIASGHPPSVEQAHSLTNQSSPTRSSNPESAPSGDISMILPCPAHAPIPPMVVGPPFIMQGHSTITGNQVRPALFEPTVSVTDPERLLNIFRDRLTTQIPFVVVPRSTTVESLRKEKPFVYMSIMMAASYEDTATQLVLGNKILELLTERLILRGEKSLDLLQGLLIYVFSYHLFLHINAQINNLLGLLSAQSVDLGFKKVSAQNEVQETFVQAAKKVQGHIVQVKVLTAEEKRAFLGCYYLSSCLTWSFSRLDCLHFTPYIEDCYEAIAEAGEYATDAQLANWMKLQSLVEKQRVSGLWESFGSHNSYAPRAPVGMLVRSFQIELLNFKNSLPRDHLLNPVFALNYYSAEISLYEVCFKMSPAAGVDYNMESLRAIDIIYACFLATKSFFEAFLSIAPAEYCTLSIVNVGQMFHAFGTLHKLSIFNLFDWDTYNVRKTLDLFDILNKIAMRLQELAHSYGPNEKNSSWLFCSQKLRLLKSWWEATLAQELDSSVVPMMPQDIMFDELQCMVNSDFWDDTFWK